MRLEPWKLRRVPPSAYGFHEQYARIHAPALNVDIVALIGQSHCLRGDNLKVVVDAAFIAVGEELKGLLRGCCRLMLLVGLFFKDTERNKIVLDLLKGGKSRLAVSGDEAIVVLGGRRRGKFTASVVKDGLRHLRTNSPDAAEPVAPIIRVGKNAARAIPICSLASSTRRSSAAISGRRSRSSEGNPTGTDGRWRTVSGAGARVNLAGGCPIKTAIACSNCARLTVMSVSCTRAASSCVCAWATSDMGAAPPSKRFWVNCSALV